MQAFLMHPDTDFDPEQALPGHADDLRQDLELDTLFAAMAGGDELVLTVAQQALLSACGNDLATVLYRQAIVKDCLDQPAAIRRMYALASEAVEAERKSFLGLFSRKSPHLLLYRSLALLPVLLAILARLRDVAVAQAPAFRSDGLTRLADMLGSELSDAYFERVRGHLKTLKFRHGVLVRAGLGPGNRATGYTLLKPQDRKPGWLAGLFATPPGHTFKLHPRDESGARALSDLRDRGLHLVANALAQSVDHIVSFFGMLRLELAFYVGCLNLHEKLAAKGLPRCFPQPETGERRRHRCSGLYDPCLALTMDEPVVGNDIDADAKNIVIVTGANRGGKSTFLRSIGVAQLLMQAGSFAPATALRASLCSNLFSHFKREEDAGMRSGKLDEELARMSAIVERLTPQAMILLNESFAATNEREGSAIAGQICSALLESCMQLFFVTHLYDFARDFYRRGRDDALFLRAERRPDGQRSFGLVAAEPLATGFAKDLYRRLFEADRNHPP